MPHDTEDMIQLLLSTNKEQEQTIVDLRATIKRAPQHDCEPERDDR